jgi:hypothetical protein
LGKAAPPAALSGRGLVMIGCLADRLEVRRGRPTGMVVRHIKCLT